MTKKMQRKGEKWEPGTQTGQSSVKRSTKKTKGFVLDGKERMDGQGEEDAHSTLLKG